MKFRLKVISVTLIFLTFLSTNFPSTAISKIPAHSWIDKTPKKRENCGVSNSYCVAVKIDPIWVSECMSNLGDAIHVEVEYFNRKGTKIGYGLDSHRNFTIYKDGKISKVREIISYPSASRYPANPQLIKFDSVKVTKVSCLSY